MPFAIVAHLAHGETCDAKIIGDIADDNVAETRVCQEGE